MNAFDKAERELRMRGVILRRMDGGEGYQVSVGSRVETFLPEEFDQAVEYGCQVPVPVPQGVPRRGRCRRPRSAKQARRWWIKKQPARQVIKPKTFYQRLAERANEMS